MITSSLDKVTAERHQLDRNYRAARQAEFAKLCADPLHGTHLRKLVATLNHFGPNDAERMIAYWRTENEKWLCVASNDIRAAALSALGERIVRIRIKSGLVPFDDPVPGEPDCVFRICKGIIGI
jgi:hypothetical protein